MKSSVESRPYSGNWQPGKFEVVNTAPDAIVHINGESTLPGCGDCGGRLDLQRYITAVSSDNATSPNAHSSTINLAIPVAESHGFFVGEQCILQAGLEVHCFAKGYFPMKGLYGSPQEVDDVAKGSSTSNPATDSYVAGTPTYDSSLGRKKLGATRIKDLQNNIWEMNKGQIKAQYPVDRLKGIVQQACAAQKPPVDPYLLWGTLSRESAGGGTPQPVGVSYGEADVGFGMAQTNFQQWDDIKQHDKQGEIWWGHDELGDPRKAIWTAAKQLSRYGVKTPIEARALWWGSKSKKQTDPKVIAEAAGFDKFKDTFKNKVPVRPGDEGPPVRQTAKSQVAKTDSGQAYGALGKTETDPVMQDMNVVPYYQIFHGVVTSVDLGWSTGFRTVTLQCASMLHFWQTQLVTQSGARLATGPAGNGDKSTFNAHRFTGMSPYSIIYTLHREVGGDAGGVEFVLNQKTNVTAKNDAGKSMYSLYKLYWERRFAQKVNALRMYGVSGNLYNTSQQAYLGALGAGEGGGAKTDRVAARRASDKGSTSSVKDPLKKDIQKGADGVQTAKTAVVDPTKAPTVVKLGKKSVGSPTKTAVKTRSSGFSAGSTGDFDSTLIPFDPETLTLVTQGSAAMKLSAGSLQAFHADLGQMANVNFWESTYQTKLDVASQVCQVTGFEFFQDFDGDFVFKPPFYNLDTRGSPVYRIRPIDIISYNEKEDEPSATYIKVTGSSIEKNLGGTGLEGEFGTKSTFVDWKLVSKFGWKEATLEAAYYTDSRQLFYAGMTRMALENLNVKTGSVTIPFRPEIRMGYPVYFEDLDCFWYCTGVSHSFAFGGQCTTSLTLAGKRTKFYAPGDPSIQGIEGIDLSNPYLPPRALMVEGDDGMPKEVGFPNVVMTIDPTTQSPVSGMRDFGTLDLTKQSNLEDLINTARYLQVLSLAPQEGVPDHVQWRQGPWYLATGNTQGITFTLKDLLSVAAKPATASKGKKKKKALTAAPSASPFAEILKTIVRRVSGDLDPKTASASRILSLLDDQKSNFMAGKRMGTVRYYSSSHPDPKHQGVPICTESKDGRRYKNLDLSRTGVGFVRHPTTITGRTPPEAQLGKITVSRGIAVSGVQDIKTTDQISTIVLTEGKYEYEAQVNVVDGVTFELSLPTLQEGLAKKFVVSSQDMALSAPAFKVIKRDWDALYKVATAHCPGISLLAFENFEFPLGIGLPSTQVTEGGSKVPKQKTVAEVTDQVKVLPLVWMNRVSAASRQYWQDSLSGWFQNSTQVSVSKTALTSDALALQKVVSTVRYLTHPAKVPVTKPQTMTSQVAIQPISDAGGYEVIGYYRYGRGLDIAPGSTFDEVLRQDPLRYAEKGELNKFLKKLKRVPHEGYPAGKVVFKSGDTEALKTAARIAAQDIGRMNLGFNVTPDTIGNLSAGQKETLMARLEDWATNALDGTNRLTVANAALTLSQVNTGVSGQGCACSTEKIKGLLIAGAPSGFLEVEKIPAWLKEEALTSGQELLHRRKVLAGDPQDAGATARAFDKGSLKPGS